VTDLTTLAAFIFLVLWAYRELTYRLDKHAWDEERAEILGLRNPAVSEFVPAAEVLQSTAAEDEEPETPEERKRREDLEHMDQLERDLNVRRVIQMDNFVTRQVNGRR